MPSSPPERQPTDEAARAAAEAWLQALLTRGERAAQAEAPAATEPEREDVAM